MGTPDENKVAGGVAPEGGAAATEKPKPEPKPEPKAEAPKPVPKVVNAAARPKAASKPKPEKKAEAPKPEPKAEAPKPEPKADAPKPEPEAGIDRVLIVSAKREGFRRAGRVWSITETAVHDGDLIEDQIQAVMDEPMLVAYWAPIRAGAARMVRAKFVVRGNEDGKVELEPVTGGSAENDTFFNYTPWGKLEMGIVNPAALPFFVVGREVYLDFMPAD